MDLLVRKFMYYVNGNCNKCSNLSWWHVFCAFSYRFLVLSLMELRHVSELEKYKIFRTLKPVCFTDYIIRFRIRVIWIIMSSCIMCYLLVEFKVNILYSRMSL